MGEHVDNEDPMRQVEQKKICKSDTQMVLSEVIVLSTCLWQLTCTQYVIFKVQTFTLHAAVHFQLPPYSFIQACADLHRTTVPAPNSLHSQT